MCYHLYHTDVLLRSACLKHLSLSDAIYVYVKGAYLIRLLRARFHYRATSVVVINMLCTNHAAIHQIQHWMHFKSTHGQYGYYEKGHTRFSWIGSTSQKSIEK